MMIPPHKNPACIFSCLVACFTTTALTTFVTLFATSVLVPTPIHKQALAAAMFDILALATLFVFVVFYTCTVRSLRSWSYQRRWMLLPIALLPFAIAMILSISVLGWMYNHIPLVDTHGPTENVATMIAAAIAMWAVSLISLGLYFTLCFRQNSSLPDSVISTSNPLRSCIDVAEHKPHSLSLNTLSTTPNRPISTFSDISEQSATPISSVRNSVQHFLRHGKSSKSVLKQSKDSLHSDSLSERRPSDGFETWDIASTPASADSAGSLAALRAAHLQRLETIPGSRPVSPAHPLDGPFPEACEDEEADEVPESFPPFAPSMGHRPSAHQQQQQPQDQSHIHPLFRSDSPTPSPTASPGTIITSSPFAGQLVNPNEIAFGSRSRKGSTLSSRPSSPNPSLIRAGSALSLRGLAGQQLQRPRVTMSPSLGDLRAERDKFVKAPQPVLHKRERSA